MQNYNRHNGDATSLRRCANGYNGNTLDFSDVESFFPAAANVPKSVDLREWGIVATSIDQGTCGSCYAFSTRYVMTASVVHDLPYYRQVYTVLNNTTTSLNTRMSVQMILNDSNGANQYCGGGNFQYAAGDIAVTRVPSMDFESAIPYSAMMESDDSASQPTPDRIAEAKTLEFEETPLIPMHYFNGGSCPNGVFTYDPIHGNVFLDADRENIKRMLAAGMPLSGKMLIGGSTTDADNTAFNMYSGGIAAGDCSAANTSNHQVTLVGYGHYQQKPVWLFQNSWGTSWGMFGYFMVEMGANTLCTESEVFGVVPRYRGFDKVNEPLDVAFNETQLYIDWKNVTYLNKFNSTVRRGMNGMDLYGDDGLPYFVSTELPTYKWVLVALLGLAGAIFLMFAVKCLCCPQMKKLTKPIYVKFTEEEAGGMDWSKAVGYEADAAPREDMFV